MSTSIHSSNHDKQSKATTENAMQRWSATTGIPSAWDVASQAAENSPLLPYRHDIHLQAFCEQLTHTVRILCEARTCGLTLLPLQPWASPLYAFSGTASAADVRFAYHPMAGWPGWIVSHKRLLLVPDCADDTALRRFAPLWTWHTPYDIGMVSCHTESQYLGVPFLINEKVIGVLGLLRHRDDPAFLAVDGRILMGAAERHAAIIERLRQEQAKDTGILDVLFELHHLRTQGALLTKMWDVVLKQGLPILGFDAGHIRVKKGNKLVLCALQGYSSKRPPRVRLLGQGISGWVAKHQRLLRIGHNRSSRRVGIPLIDNDRIVGTLIACQHRGDVFTEIQLRWLQVMASMVAAEIQSRWLRSVIETSTSVILPSTSSVSNIRVDAIAPREEDVLFEHVYGHLVG